ncbi:hypothetical protein CWC54_05225 [Enterococcus faecium]|nr:hypothetical protein CWC54_05225 [Enterococcus faecium]
MNDFTTEIVQTLVTKGDLNELFRSHLEKAINTLLRTELTAFLDYEKYDRTGFNLASIRRTIYSTNLIESFNKQIKRYSRRKEQFQNEESLERFLVSIFDTYNQKFLNRSHKGFQQVTDTLVSMFTE